MHNQQWLTVGVSTLVAGTVASVVLPAKLPAKPIALVIASTVGAMGGIVLTNLQQSYVSKLRAKNSSIQGNTELMTADQQPGVLATRPDELILPIEKPADRLMRLEYLLKQNNRELATLKEQLDQILNTKDKRKTAIFYDVENLLKGYSFSQAMLANLSLKGIFNAIQATGNVGQIAVQQAYANWSDPRLKIMRGEINELGINPIQIFGFSREPTKNAADIQLVIDAINLANIRPSIEVFVIVSGDGGFASLAKQLHEYGKIVIGCAYQDSTSKTFQAVCDDFVWISDPEEQENLYQISKSTLPNKQADGPDFQHPRSTNAVRKAVLPPTTNPATSKQLDGLDPRNARLANQITPRVPTSLQDALALTREILNWYASDRLCRLELLKTGIYLSVVEQAVSYLIPELQTFQLGQLGFPKFIEYMQYVCKGSEFCVVRVLPSNVLLALRDAIPKNAQILPDLESREVHSVDTYRSILTTGSPIYRLPGSRELRAIATWLVDHPCQQTDLGTLIDEIASGLNNEISAEVVRLTLFSFLSAGLFIREPEGFPASEQKLWLREEITSVDMALQTLRGGILQKLAAVLPSVNEEIVRQILPD